ncbi:hypothetical protein [Desulfonatronovibrio magnus]|uniref:hypothetical protein n=1 Tax=Desulfonatronovibrio magnus TaxID=698827 RepID=UPI0005EBC8F0|nr:hypothetical protein [Desulfonatronovibrio magnus]
MEQASSFEDNIESRFLSLTQEEKTAVITHGVALRISDLKNRLFLAESKVRSFEEKYQTTLDDLEARGLPDDADMDMHEDYIMWHHWTDEAANTKNKLKDLE